jgi:hypothetical protein
MSSINDIKITIIKKVEELLTLNLNNFKETNKLSTTTIGKDIGKIINEEMITLKKSVKIKKKEVIVKEIINNEDKELQSKLYKLYIKNMIKKLKEEDRDKKNKRNILELFEESNNMWKKTEKK